MRITAFRGTIEEYRTARHGPDGFVWLSLERRHAEGFAALAARRGGVPCVTELAVETDGFLVVDGQGLDISYVDRTAFDGIPPTLMALREGYPGILYRNVLDIADRGTFKDPADVLAVRDLSRITPLPNKAASNPP